MSAALSDPPLPGFTPIPIKARISIEALLQWAFAPGREGGAIWKADAQLSMDQGLTAKPRRRPRGSWILAEACAGMRFASPRAVTVCATTDRDAHHVVSAIEMLPSRIAEKIRRHARAKTRPDWLDTEARLERVLSPKGKPLIAPTNNRHRNIFWCPLKLVIDRNLTETSQKRWSEWRHGLEALQSRLVDNTLERWIVNDYLPPEAPWNLPKL